MKKILIVALLFSLPVFADAYKCKDSSGKITVSSSPCPDYSYQVKTVPDSSPSITNYNRAQSDLERQKAWLNRRQSQQARDEVTVAAVQPYDSYGNTEKIHACLMAVTATPRLTGYAAASRRLGCFAGTRGRSAECESAVSSTPNLSMSDENQLQARCRTFQ